MISDCIIVEDEPLARERIEQFTRRLPFLNLVATFDNALDALHFLTTHQVGILFLDINLGAFSGIQLLETASINSQVILTTAYPDYALKGYELKIADYLLKPFTFERFLQAVNRARELQQTAPTLPPQYPTAKNVIFIKTEYRLEKVMLDDILFIEGKGDYRRIHTNTRRLMTLQTFVELEQELPPQRICRVHKSYMVAIDKIEAIERERIKIGDVFIPISETYRQAFFDIIFK
jgi:two-component system, LytTR family, response regulator